MADLTVKVTAQITEVVSESTGNLILLVEGYVDGKLCALSVADPREYER